MRDFIPGSLHRYGPLPESPQSAPHVDGAKLVAKHTHHGLVDLCRLGAELLLSMRMKGMLPPWRARLLMDTLDTLALDPRAQLALWVVTSLRPQELEDLPRSALLTLRESLAAADPFDRDAAERLLEGPLGRSAPTAWESFRGVQVLSSGVGRDVRARAARHLSRTLERSKPGSLSGVVVLVVPVSERFTDSATLARLLAFELERNGAAEQAAQVRFALEARRLVTLPENRLLSATARATRRLAAAWRLINRPWARPEEELAASNA